MSISTKIFGTLGLALMALGMQLPAKAQTIEIEAPTAAAQPVEMQSIQAQLKAPTAAAQPVEMQSIQVQLEAQPEVQLEAQTNSPTAPTEIAPVEAVLPIEVAPVEAASWTQPESLTAEALQLEAVSEPLSNAEADELTFPAAQDSTELAQARRRTRNTAGGSDFIGVGADFGYADDVSFAVISKLSLSEQVSLRPSVLIGDDLSVLVPVTFDLNTYSTDVSGFRIIPYAGVGASYQDSSDDENFNLLLSAGADVPLSQQFTLNAQANVGVLNGTDFGVTVGVGYNFGDLFR